MITEPLLIPGSVCWIDVSSCDVAGSRDFYAGLFGWTYQIDSDPDRGSYSIALCAGLPVAGLVEVPVATGRLTAWTVYLTCADIIDTAGEFRRRGGRVRCAPAEVPGGAMVCVAADPTGGVIGLGRPESRQTVHTRGPGSLWWAELNTWDGPRADVFFANLFGYRQRQIGDGRDVDYTIWSSGGRTMLGRLQMNTDWAAPDIRAHWMVHFAVNPRAGTDATVDRVLELGGGVDFDPYDTELGRIARVTDPYGAPFALIDPTPDGSNQSPTSTKAPPASTIPTTTEPAIPTRAVHTQ